MRGLGAFWGIGALCLLPLAAGAQSVSLHLDDHLEFEAGILDYRLNLDLTAVAPTRIGVDALLDLTEYQAEMPELLRDYPLAESCESELDLDHVTLVVEGSEAILQGAVRRQLFTCKRIDDTGFQRIDGEAAQTYQFLARATGGVQENCFVAELVDMQLTQADGQTLVNFRDETRDLLRAAANAVLLDHPFCLDLPPELAGLDPQYETVGLEEIGAGGFGLRLRGSADVSTATILALLPVLQGAGVLPGPP